MTMPPRRCADLLVIAEAEAHETLHRSRYSTVVSPGFTRERGSFPGRTRESSSAGAISRTDRIPPDDRRRDLHDARSQLEHTFLQPRTGERQPASLADHHAVHRGFFRPTRMMLAGRIEWRSMRMRAVGDTLLHPSRLFVEGVSGAKPDAVPSGSSPVSTERSSGRLVWRLFNDRVVDVEGGRIEPIDCGGCGMAAGYSVWSRRTSTVQSRRAPPRFGKRSQVIRCSRE